MRRRWNGRNGAGISVCIHVQNTSGVMVTDKLLVLRVMPDDNSCMCKCCFCTTLQCDSTDSDLSPVTAFGGALGLENPSTTLRNKVADYILSHPNEYSEAILGDKPGRYTTRMRQMDT